MKFCPLCNQPLIKMNSIEFCPLHGIIAEDQKENKKKDTPSYIN